MNFKTFFYLKESPDEVYTNDGNWLNPGDSDTRTFGWFAFINEVEPFLICSKRGRMTHWDLYHDFFQHLSIESNLATPPSKYYIPNYHNIVKQLKKTKHWEAISRGDFVSKLDKDSDEEEGLGGYNIKAEVESAYRTKVFNNSGRIWLNSKVISFWNKQGDVPAERIKEILDLFNKSPEDFCIDVVDLSNIEDEESDRKKLPTVKEYLSTLTATKGASEEQEKKYQELLAKKHVATDPKERKQIQQKIYGDTQVTRTPLPLNIKQQAMTSESFKRR